jgi:hypothetical protein
MRRCIPLALFFVFTLSTAAQAQSQFTRGDANSSGGVDLSDASFIFNFLFLGGEAPVCDDATDSNDSGFSDLSDGVYVLNFLFTGGSPPPAPYADCGCDPTEDALDCAATSDSCVDVGPCGGDDDCLDQAGLDTAIAKSVPPIVCIAADAAEIEAGDLLITVCPSDVDPVPICDGEPGCPVEFDEISGALDVDGRVVNAFVSGSITNMPLSVLNTAIGSTVECSVDIEFSGNATIDFITEVNDDGDLVLVEILSPVFDRDSVEIDLSASGGILCLLLAGFIDLFLDDLLDQLDAAAAELLEDLNEQLAGRILCPVE